LVERWRKPIEVLNIEQSDEIVVGRDGRIQRAVNLELAPESIERLREGYACLKCFEPFEQAWPARCPVCGAPIARDQRLFFAREYAGVVPAPQRLSVDEEVELMFELIAREEEEKRKR